MLPRLGAGTALFALAWVGVVIYFMYMVGRISSSLGKIAKAIEEQVRHKNEHPAA